MIVVVLDDKKKYFFDNCFLDFVFVQIFEVISAEATLYP
jgi:hypothetical protein